MQDSFPLSKVQLAYLLGQSAGFEMGGVSTHVYYEFVSDVDPVHFNVAINQVVRAQPMLRAVIKGTSGQTIIDEVSDYAMACVDLNGWSEEEQSSYILGRREKLSCQSFLHDKWPLFHFEATKLSHGKIYLFCACDMLIADGYSLAVMMNEIMQCYEKRQGPTPLLTSFQEYIEKFSKPENKRFERDKKYWLERIGDIPPSPNIPVKLSKDAKTNVTKRLSYTMSETAWERIKAIAKQKGLTQTDVLNTAYVLVLRQWCGQNCFTINMPITDRPHKVKGIERVIGDFTKILLLPLDLSNVEEESFWFCAANVHKSAMRSYLHSAFDGLDIIKELAKSHGDGTSIMPIVFTSMLFSDGNFDALTRVGELKYGLSQTPQVTLDCQVMEVEGELFATWDYATAYLEGYVVEKMFAQFSALLSSIDESGKQWCKALEVLSEDKALLENYNATEKDIPQTTLQNLVCNPLKSLGEKIAVRDSSDALSFAELDRLSDSIARFLSRKGIGKGCFVGVLAERKVQTVANIIGVIKSGAAYVPVDPDYPEARRRYILSNSNCALMLAAPDMDTDGAVDANSWEMPFVDPFDTAYIIYTSGSTGTPKGVEVTHDAVCNTILDVNERWAISQQDVLIGLSSFCFDLSVYDIFGSLFAGAELVIVPDIRDVPNIARIIREWGITIWNSVPAVMKMFVDQIERADIEKVDSISSIRLCLMSGDWIPVTLPMRIKRLLPDCKPVSLGGATEGSIWSIFYEINDSNHNCPSVPYGHPLSNQKMLILGENLRQCPIDVMGEIYIGGRGVAKSYYNNLEKTKESYIHTLDWGRIYKTGDYGKMLTTGVMEFLGRKDSQVKIGGHRIELGDIESVLCEKSGITDAVVATQKMSDGRDILCAYYIDEVELSKKELLTHLEQNLPYYMIPQYYIRIDAIPLTANGKLNKAMLPLPNDLGKDESAIEPLSDVQKRLAQIWEQVLDIRNPPVSSNFFALGGDSVSMVRLLSQIKAEIGIDIPFQKFVQASTIEEVSTLIGENDQDELDEEAISFTVDPSAKWETFPLSELQESYFVGRDSHAGYAGVITNGYVEMECKAYNHNKMCRVVKMLLDRHDMLRCAIYSDGTQQFLREVDWDLPLANVSASSIEEQERYLLQVREEMLSQKLDLTKPPLLSIRATLVAHDHAIIHIYVDGLIIDGWSYEVFHAELELLYGDESIVLPPLGVTYKDYVEYKSIQKKTKKYQRDRAFWLEKMENLPASATLPLLKPLHELGQARGGQVKCALTIEEWRALEEQAKQYGVSGFAVLFTSFAAVISRWNYKSRFMLNIPEFDRPGFHADVDKIIGICSSFLLFTIENKKEPFLEVVIRNQEQLWELKDHNSFSGMEVLREIYKRNSSYTDALVPIVFGMMAEVPQTQKELLRVCYQENHTSQIWIDINTILYNDALEFNWNYVEGLMDRQMLEAMVELQKDILRKAAYYEDFWDEILELPLPENEQILINQANATHQEFIFQSFPEIIWNSFLLYEEQPLIITLDNIYTYKDVRGYVRNMAAKLRDIGVKNNDIVGVHLGKGIEQIVSVLSVVSLGATYMPIEFSYPTALTLKCLNNVQGDILITTEEKAKIFASYDVITITPFLSDSKEIDISLPIPVKEYAPIAIIYTSGSTGIPKAAPISQAGLLNAILFTVDKFLVSADDRAIGLTNLAHDMSMFDLFGMIYAGGSIALPTEEGARDPSHWEALIERGPVTIWNSVPAMQDMFFQHMGKRVPESLKSLRLVISGGDYLHVKLANTILTTLPDVRLVNVGGPAETTLWNIYHEVRPEDVRAGVIPYGKPIPNTKYYLLNENLEEVPVGVIGMMYCAGVGVTTGYLGNHMASLEAFIKNPRTGERLYKTGDLGKYSSSGEIYFMGREDFQVKILGKRIELDGITAILRQIDGVISCVTKLTDNKQGILAYYVAKREISEREFIEMLLANLPGYMLPKAFIRLEQMPIMPNGKIDRKALPDPGESSSMVDRSSSAPRDEVERRLVEVYSEILGTAVDIDSDFFVMGGNSLLAVRAVSEIREAFQIDLGLTEMFTATTIRELYDLIREKKDNTDGKEVITSFP